VIREPTAEFAGVVPDVPWLEHADSDHEMSSAAAAAATNLGDLIATPPIEGLAYGPKPRRVTCKGSDGTINQ